MGWEVHHDRRAALKGRPLAARTWRALELARLTPQTVLVRAGASAVVLVLQPSRSNSELLGTGRKILCLVTEDRWLSRDDVIELAGEAVSRTPQVTAELVFVVSNDSETSQKCRDLSEDVQTTVVGLSAEDVGRCAPYGRRTLIRLVQSRFYSRDLYTYSTPVREAPSFFGRRELIDQATTSLKKAGSNVGLFGLRRMGKTSLMYRIHARLKTNESAYVAHIDVERIDGIEASVEYFLWSLGEAIYDAHRAIRAVDGLRMFGRSSSIVDLDRAQIPELFRHDLDRILRNIRRPIVVSIDELEMMFPPTAVSPGWTDAFVPIWRLLRGMSQEYNRRLVFLLAGTNPHPIEAPKVGAADNPIYQWIDINFLRPLTQAESRELLAKVGARMGLRWTNSAADYVYGMVGGHPLLTRAYGSLVHKALLPRESEVGVDEPTARSCLTEFTQERSGVLEQMLLVLAEQYPDEHMMLEMLAEGRVGEYRSYASVLPELTHHLTGYGLVGDESGLPAIQIDLLQSVMQRRQSDLGGARRAQLTTPGPGEIVGGDRYELLYEIGVPGGYSDVFVARVTESSLVMKGEEVAVKMFRKGTSFQQLQREVDALTQIQHPNVVKILDHGSEPNGRHYVVMEYLRGDPLSSRCDRANRLSSPEAGKLLRQLLEALVVIHPDPKLVERGRAQEYPSSSDVEETARARHGYIHRDIKPDNVVVVADRGPVLIDFNISSKSGASRQTSSATPGFARPAEAGGAWTPGHDLYGLGLTIACASVGVLVPAHPDPTDHDRAIADLMEMVRKELEPHLAAVVERLCESDPVRRYACAADVLADL